eukprot:5309777-Pyramimonas_sp.AAC.1
MLVAVLGEAVVQQAALPFVARGGDVGGDDRAAQLGDPARLGKLVRLVVPVAQDDPRGLLHREERPQRDEGVPVALAEAERRVQVERHHNDVARRRVQDHGGEAAERSALGVAPMVEGGGLEVRAHRHELASCDAALARGDPRGVRRLPAVLAERLDDGLGVVLRAVQLDEGDAVEVLGAVGLQKALGLGAPL